MITRRVYHASAMAPKTRSANPRKPSRGKHAWSIREEEYLAELYEDQTFIFNTQHPDYLKKEKKDNKHVAIAALLNIPRKFPVLSPTRKISIGLIYIRYLEQLTTC